jgi:hypothetical protein
MRARLFDFDNRMLPMTIVIVQSSVTQQWNYCPEPALSLLRLDMDDKPSGYNTAMDARRAAKQDRSIPTHATFRVQK